MSIKKLFDSTDKTRQYLTDQEQKTAFKEIESSRNLQQLKTKQDSFLPQVDYTEPGSFAKFGSAYLYYKSSIERILDFYPYDGSDAELNAFYNKSLSIDKYIFNNLYPRRTGYATLSVDGWSTVASSSAESSSNGGGYGLPSTTEYITFYGGPNVSSDLTDLKDMEPNPLSSKFQTNNIYDQAIYDTAGLRSDYGQGTRESNLKSDFDAGVTVEFWLKTGSLAQNLTGRQVVFDMWNNEATGSTDYARLTIELTSSHALGLQPSAAGPDTPFLITAQSGTLSASAQSIITSSIGQSIADTALGDWAHYAFVLQNTGSDFVAELYVNGYHNATNTYSGITLNELQTKNMVGRIGALLTAPSGAAPEAPTNFIGAGKLSGSIDEFRFWKVARDGGQIGKNWFDQIRGGVNTDISNTELGMYYKFNEGNTGVTSIDSVVLDYGGRICNGTWTGYTSTSRNTGSAILSASAAIKEYEDPIIYPEHPSVSALKTSLLKSGSYHDSQNSALVRNLVPAWLTLDAEISDETDLDRICHILGAYFDTLYLQISALPTFKHANYVSASHEPLPFSQHLPQSLGLYMPEVFIDATILEKFKNRTDNKFFEGDLKQAKDLIYSNLYNNLAKIYKAKGTEKAIRNVLRCFNLDDSLVSYRVYSNNQQFELKSNLKQTRKNEKYANFNSTYATDAVVHQYADPHTGSTRGYIAGSGEEGKEDRYGFTAETSVVFPKFIRGLDTFDRSFKDVSVFGMQTVNTASTSDTAFLTWSAPTDGEDYANFQVYAIRDTEYSKNVYFKLTSSVGPHPFPTLTSSAFFDVYDDSSWNLSVRIKPSSSFTDLLQGPAGLGGAAYTTGYSSYSTYDVIFRGVNNNLGVIQNSFVATGSVTKEVGKNILKHAKRMYCGARNTNITGSNIHKSDVLVSSLKYWTKYIGDTSLDQHLFDGENYGISGSYESPSPIDSGSVNTFNFNTLALNWYFGNVTSSNAAGEFYVTDLSSGSADFRSHFGWMADIGSHLHSGKGVGFSGSATDVVNSVNTNYFKFIDPEQVVASDQVQVLTDDDKIFGLVEQVPNYVYTIEKSLYGSVTEEILDFFAGAIDFHNLIGQPVNRYRERYKSLEYLRKIYFDRVQDVQTVEKFTEYYKWFDDAISIIIGQLVPASANFIPDIYNVVESHALERHKYKTQFPTFQNYTPLPEGALKGGLTWFDWEVAHPPPPESPRPTNVKKEYWQRRAETDAVEITSGDATVDSQRQTIKNVMWSRPYLSRSMPTFSTKDGTRYHYNANQSSQTSDTYVFDAKIVKNIKGGVNFDGRKSLEYTFNALQPAGPVNTDSSHLGSVFVPRNVLLGKIQDLVQIQELEQQDRIKNNPGAKVKRVIKVESGRDFEDGVGYTTTKSTFSFPFNIMSSSVRSGHNKDVLERVTASVEITNLHNDVYGDDMERPMQGPWSEYAAGGHQSRHVPLNKYDANKNTTNNLDHYTNRPEAWKIVLGDCGAGTGAGAIGMVGPDYPWPEANAIGERPYPMTASQKAVYYRDHVAKTPYVFKNIHMRTGSTILGNYRHNYEVVHTVGATSNPRQFIKNQPTLPTEAFQDTAISASVTRTFLDIHRDSDGHFEFMSPYSISYLNASPSQSSVIVSKFSNPGGLEVSPAGYRNIRANEFSVYNATNYRNLSIIKPSQGPSGSVSEATGSGGPGIRVADIHSKDYGLRSHLARHTARFGRDSLWVTGDTYATNGPGASYDQLPGYHKVHRNGIPRMRLTGTSSTGTVISSSLYDNFFVQHQIPRSDKQYAWITGATKHSTDLRYSGFMPTIGTLEGMYSSSVGGFEPFFSFVSASDFGSTAASHRLFGSPQSSAGTSFVPTDLVGINTNIYESIDASTNTVGSNDLTVARNSTFVTGVNFEGSGALFNALMFHRGNVYGWGTFQQSHQGDHPILRNQRKNNKLCIVYKTPHIPQEFDLRPVSVRGLPVIVNFDYETEQIVKSERIIKTANATLKTSYNNEFIYFNSRSLDDHFDIPTYLKGEITPFEQLVALKDMSGITLNWIHYKESLFPSLKNEFSPTSSFRLNYDNLMWRDSLAGRIELGSKTIYSNSLGLVGMLPDGNPTLSASSWPLDAPRGFLTRKSASCILNLTGTFGIKLSLGALRGGGAAVTGAAVDGRFGGSGNIARNPGGVAGELQNTYGWFHQTSSNAEDGGLLSGSLLRTHVINSLSPAALYARKHTLLSPLSINSPNFSNPSCSVQDLSERGGLSLGGFATASLGAGEAWWDAPETAGYFSGTIATDGVKALSFVTAASKPWYGDYDKFKETDLKYRARGYSVVPEYRISERIEDYLKGDVDDFNDFSIPGTEFDSKQVNFYKDFSNSDFMEKFLDIRQMSDLQAKEFKLTCHAVLKFNPYKGFYPADRTLQLVSQFSRSYGNSLRASGSLDPEYTTNTPLGPGPGLLRPVLQPLFAPGILYNSIKAGMACDWPMITDGSRITKVAYSGSAADTNLNWALYPSTTPTSGSHTLSGSEYTSGMFWDTRLPFEAIINPGAHMNGMPCIDMEPHPLVDIGGIVNYTASIAGAPADNLYTLMASNFVAEVGDFFLDGGNYSRLETPGVSLGTRTFSGGAVFGARLRLKTSYSGSRTYEFESSSHGNNNWFTQFGAGAVYNDDTPAYNRRNAITTGSFEIPQDPNRNEGFRRDFVMYSRTTAFGPPIANRVPEEKNIQQYSTWAQLSSSLGVCPLGTGGSQAATGSWVATINAFYASGSAFGIMDCMNGYNWAYTPPYQHGEAWCDFIFRPTPDKEYSLEQMISELTTSYYRVDPGPQTSSAMISWGANLDNFYYSSLIRDNAPLSGARSATWPLPGAFPGYPGQAVNANNSPYASVLINDNAMQLSSSFNLFGIENVYKKRFDKFGREILTETEVVGKRWVIQTKFETPMLNFADFGEHPISGSAPGTPNLTKTIPATDDAAGRPAGFGSDTAANGMWHQFGTRPARPNQGIFLEIGDIPASWLQYHYLCVSESSVYNNFDPALSGPAGTSNLHKTVQSLSELMGFTEQNSRVRMGELSEKHVIKEAIVAVPYIAKDVGFAGGGGGGVFGRKEFISIPKARYKAATGAMEDSATGDSLDTAGQSIRQLVAKMKDYVLPKRFDFLRNPLIDPIVMYMFEFKYELDKDDLSYIWQNLAPRNYERLLMQKDVVAHELFNTELLTEKNIMENSNLRWMVFKVKQRSQKVYRDKVVPKFGMTTTDPIVAGTTEEDYPLLYNWPYDYLSIVESVKLEAEVLYSNAEIELAEEIASPAGPEEETPELIIPTATSTTLNRDVRSTVPLDFDEEEKVIVKKVTKGDPVAATKLRTSVKKKKKITKLSTPRKGKSTTTKVKKK